MLTDQKSVNLKKQRDQAAYSNYEGLAASMDYSRQSLNELRVNKHRRDLQESQLNKNDDINKLQDDIHNRINLAIMQIDQMSITQDLQSMHHNYSKLEEVSNSQHCNLLNNDHKHFLNMTTANSQHHSKINASGNQGSNANYSI